MAESAVRTREHRRERRGSSGLLSRTLRPSGRLSSASPLTLTALIALATACTLGVLLLLAAGRFSATDAIAYAAAPWVGLAAVFRPDWLVLALIAMPASFTSIVQTRRMLLLAVIALVALLVTRPKFSLGLRTGLAAIAVIILAGALFQANVGAEALAVNEGQMLSLTYYLVLALLAFNLALLRELDGKRIAIAFMVGVASTVVVGLAGYGNAWMPGGTAIIQRSYFGYLAVAGLGVCVGWLVRPGRVQSRPPLLYVATGLFAMFAFLSYIRAAWLAAAITLVLLAVRWKKRRYLAILALAVGLVLFLPSSRQELASSPSGDIGNSIESGEITTGRIDLWSALWDRGVSALPLGNGFGYTWSLSSRDLFGTPGQFQSDESGNIPPHNDFLYLFVEFGIVGMGLVALFWILLFRSRLLAAESSHRSARRGASLLLGILVTGLMVALFDDLFAVRPFAERFFPVAGFVFGLGQLERARRRRSSGRAAGEGSATKLVRSGRDAGSPTAPWPRRRSSTR